MNDIAKCKGSFKDLQWKCKYFQIKYDETLFELGNEMFQWHPVLLHMSLLIKLFLYLNTLVAILLPQYICEKTCLWASD